MLWGGFYESGQCVDECGVLVDGDFVVFVVCEFIYLVVFIWLRVVDQIVWLGGFVVVIMWMLWGICVDVGYV